jgi:hypothetical protein
MMDHVLTKVEQGNDPRHSKGRRQGVLVSLLFQKEELTLTLNLSPNIHML